MCARFFIIMERCQFLMIFIVGTETNNFRCGYRNVNTVQLAREASAELLKYLLQLGKLVRHFQSGGAICRQCI